ncbi:MAG: amidohydrolase [Firmicutes bacterium]|nr:amidohydrolase [Bacillota bacterium]
MKLLAAAVQYEPDPLDKQSNRYHLGELIESAASRGARLIVLPETGTTGMCWYSREEASLLVETVPGPTTRFFEELCSRWRCHLVAGMLEVDDATGIYYNSAVLVGPGGLIGHYRKNHLFLSDHKWAAAGDLGLPVWETEVGTIGIAICADMEFPETVRILAGKGAKIICCPTGWLGEKCPAATWITRAWENGVYIVAADRWGRERGIQFSGGSCVIGPDGRVIEYRDDGNGVVMAELDLERAVNSQTRRPELYHSLMLDTYRWPPSQFFGLYGYRPLPPEGSGEVGVLQMRLAEGGMTRQVELAEPLIRKAKAEHPQLKLLVLPDLISTTEKGRESLRSLAAGLTGPEVERLGGLAKGLHMYLVWGMLEDTGKDLYKTAVLWGPEGIIGYYRQAHLPDELTEAGLRPGPSLDETFYTPVGRVGLLLGGDLEYPESVRCLASAGADLVCVAGDGRLPPPLALGGTRIPHPVNVLTTSDPYHWCLGRSRAWENGCYLAVANPAGDDASSQEYRGTGVFDPAAYRRARSEQEMMLHPHEGLLVREVSTESSQRAGREVRSKEFLRRRRTELYHPLVGPDRG